MLLCNWVWTSIKNRPITMYKLSFLKTRHSHTVYSVLSSHTIMQLRRVVYVEYWCDCIWCIILHKIRTGELILEMFNNIATDSLFLSYSCLKQGLELSKNTISKLYQK